MVAIATFSTVHDYLNKRLWPVEETIIAHETSSKRPFWSVTAYYEVYTYVGCLKAGAHAVLARGGGSTA